ncbi:MFS transporter [Actinomadura parmotrematis]|uniref:MFS transporter n=1 Tax=Actinomadura parmotrematis TaxID=2864039 RepID=A0ABS7G7F2_9ACTN|nr:MFS transporter [Actinomadura parmotrematis]MBW8487722.1 MFS transporter [Actinomadura parmotrematis]
MARRLYAAAFLDDLVLLYPVYALLFADAGLSPAAISSLLVIWSVTSFALEVPSGVWADAFSRRFLLTLAPVLTGVGFALWTWWPCYAAFAAGFVLWGAGGALRSGTLEALVHRELVLAGASGGYARLMGRARALGTTATMLASALAAPVMAAGGYRAVGIASVAVCALAAVAARALPCAPAEAQGGAAAGRSSMRPGGRSDSELRGGADSLCAGAVVGGGGEACRETGRQAERGALRRVWRQGFGQVRGRAPVRRALVLLAALTFVGALDEYLPLLAAGTGASPARVPLLLVVVSAGVAVGGWCAGWGHRRLAPLLAGAALCLAGGALCGRPVGMVAVAVAFGVFEWALTVADARLQDRIEEGARATVTSIAGFGEDVVAVLAYAGYALGSVWAGPAVLFAVAAVPYLLLAVLIGVRPGSGAGSRSPARADARHEDGAQDGAEGEVR